MYANEDGATPRGLLFPWHFYFMLIERVLVDINFYPGTLLHEMQAGEIGSSSPKTSSQSFWFQVISAFVFSQNVFFLSTAAVSQHFFKKYSPIGSGIFLQDCLFGDTISFHFMPKLYWNLSEDLLSDSILAMQPTRFQCLLWELVTFPHRQAVTVPNWQFSDGFHFQRCEDVDNVFLRTDELCYVNCISANPGSPTACHIHLVYVL